MLPDGSRTLEWALPRTLGLMLLGFVACLVVACANHPAQLPPPAPVSAPTCLPLVRYSPEQQKALAAQLKTLSPDSPIAQAVIDYSRMRDADRACLSSK